LGGKGNERVAQIKSLIYVRVERKGCAIKDQPKCIKFVSWYCGNSALTVKLSFHCYDCLIDFFFK